MLLTTTNGHVMRPVALLLLAKAAAFEDAVGKAHARARADARRVGPAGWAAIVARHDEFE